MLDIFDYHYDILMDIKKGHYKGFKLSLKGLWILYCHKHIYDFYDCILIATLNQKHNSVTRDELLKLIRLGYLHYETT